jgi:hypothetical protein
MAITVTVLYRNTKDLQLDLQKYLHGHAPKVVEELRPWGLRGTSFLHKSFCTF